MPASQLSPLQEDILRAFFQRENRFFLTGGAALAGFHLKHRRTADLDFFTTPDAARDVLSRANLRFVRSQPISARRSRTCRPSPTSGGAW